jgi:hypothetical protein
MKRLSISIIIALVCILSIAQVPESFNYQAIPRNSSGGTYPDQTMSIRISILAGSPTAGSVYTETFNATTNSLGLLNLQIGKGTSVSGNFAAIDWGTGSYYLKVEIDPSGGTGYIEMGVTKLLSVPYALYSKTAEKVTGAITETDPVFGAHAAKGITSALIGNWNTSFNWGNHATAGYLKSFTETDPIFGSHAASGITTTLIGNWNNAFAWGNHSTAGYLTSFTETDPIFGTHAASGITTTLIGNWNNAYSWGNHADVGYLTSFTELDPKIGLNTSGYSPKWDGSALVTGSLYQDASGNVGIGTVSPDAAMDISSTSSGILIPRMTTAERDLISTPSLGLQIYNITTNCFNVWNGTSWGQICPDCGFIPVVGNNGPICAGLTLNLTTVTIPGATYSWTGPNGFTSTLQNPNIPNATTSASGAYYVTTTLNGCTSLPISTVATITPSLGPTTTNYNNPVCIGSTLNFTATTIPGASYTWSGPNNFFSNIQNPSISNVQASHAGTYYAVATAGNCSTSASVVVTVNPVPVQPAPITGTFSLLPPQTGVAYSIPAVSGATSYTWAFSGTGAAITGQGTNTITVNFACGATGGNLTVTANNICGGSGPAQTQSIMIATLAQPGVITGTTPIVLPQTGLTYSITAVTGATSYTWTVPGTLGSITSGQGSTSITVDFACGATAGLISVVATNACGSSPARTLAINISSLPTPGTISGPGTITYPQTGVAYSVPAVSGASTYTWIVPSGATIASGQGANSILVDYACGSTSGNISVTASNICGSSGANSKSITISTSTPSTPGAISGTNNLPTGVIGVSYSISSVSGASSYTWTVPTGAGITYGQGTTSILVDYSCSAVSGDVTVTANNGCGTSSARTFAITVNSNPAQPGAISGISSVPQGSTGITYSITTVTGATSYTWSYTGTGATITSGQGTNSITVNYACGSANGNITVNASNLCGTPGPNRTLGITITGTIATPGTITGTNVPLFGQTLTPYTVALVSGATSYNWTVPSGATINSGQGTNSILVDFGCSAINGNISVTANNGCIGAGTPSNLAITLSSTVPQPGTITGITAVPQGKTGVTYSIAAVPGATTYAWSYTGTGAIIASGQGTTSITVDYGCSATSGNISVTASNACVGPGTARTLAVIINALSTPGTITGLASIPQGSTGINYTIASVAGATSYSWIVPLGATVVYGQGTTSVWVDYSCTVGSGNILVTANNACGSSGGSSLNITITSNIPATPGGISAYPSTSIPKGLTNVVHSIGPVTGAASYTWSVPAGASITSGQGTTTIFVDYSCAAVSGNVTVIANNACGSSAASALAMSLTPAPSQPGGITGVASLPKGSAGFTYSIAPVIGATLYIWSVPAGVEITSGQGTTVITVDYSCTAVSGNITVKASNACGNASSNASLAITINSSLAALGVITGTTSPLFGQNGTPYSVAAITGAINYTWSVPGDATISSGQGTNNIGVDFPCSSTNGTIVVSASNTCISSSPVSLSFALSSLALAQPGTITGLSTVPRGTPLVIYTIPAVTGATSYTWTVPLNSTIISGQGTTSILVDYSNCSAESGTISVTAGNACVSTSPAQTLGVTVTTTVLATPGIITGLQTPFSGQTGVKYSIVPVSGATSYTWSYSGTGVSIFSGQGSTVITVDYSCGATNGNINVTASNSCLATSSAQNIAITQGSTFTTLGAVSGSQSPVFGQIGVSYSVVPVIGASSYTWAVSSGATINSGQGTSSITVDFSCTAQTNGTISVIANSTCFGSSTPSALSYAMSGSVITPATIAGLTSVSKGTTGLVYTVSPVTGATSYTWSVPGGYTIASGQGTNSIKVDYGCSAANGNITVTAGNSCTTTPASSLAVTVISTLPAPGTIVGSIAPSYGSSKNYTIIPVIGASSYNWSAPTGAFLVSGAGTNSVWYSFSCGASSGNISVTVNNSCIPEGTPSNFAITPVTAPAMGTLGAITGVNWLVQGSNNITYSVSSIGAASYNWTVPGGITIISGQGTPSISVNVTGSAVSGNISVTAFNSCLSQSNIVSLPVTLYSSWQLFNTTGSGATGTFQSFTVPAGVTTITIQTWGAQGGDGTSYAGGLGAWMKGTFSVSPGQILKILVGQRGGSNTGYRAGGGGGGTFVTDNSNNPLIIAGGGGGGGGNINPQNGLPGLTGTFGGNGSQGTFNGGFCGNAGGQGSGSGAGGGLSGSAGATSCGSTTGGASFIAGGTGGTKGSCSASNSGGDGGFGGGGGSEWCCTGAPGGGGGYSGGAGTMNNGVGGGGGSYNAGSNQSNTSGVQNGDGKVVITW